MRHRHESDIMTIEEVAAYLRLGRRAIYRLARSGELPGRKILNRWRFHLKDVEAWVRSGQSDPGEERSRDSAIAPDTTVRLSQGETGCES